MYTIIDVISPLLMSSNTAERNYPFTKYLSFISKQYDEAIAERLKGLDINRYYYPLLLIDRSGFKLTQQMLAKRLGIDKVSVARIVSYLSSKGYISRQKNPADKREYMLETTAKANSALPQIRKAYHEANRIAFNGLGAEDIASFLKYVKAIQSNLEENKSLLHINHQLNTTSS